MEMMQLVRGFINLIKANPTTREQYKSNKLATRKYDNKVNESEIQSSSLEQVQQFVIVCPSVWLGLTMVKFSYSLVRHREMAVYAVK